MTTLRTTLFALVILAGCRGREEEPAAPSASEAKPASKPKSSASATTPASAPPKPVEPPSPVDLQQQTWTDGGTTMKLVSTDLSKVCLLKGVSLMLPEKTQLSPLMGARGCVLRGWGGVEGPYMFIVNDELAFKNKSKSELKGIKRFFDETADSYLAEDEDPKRGFFGQLERKAGERTYYCKANSNGKPNGEQIVRGMMKLCTTMQIAR